LESTSSELLTLDEEVHMQEEWHCNERKRTFVILARNLLFLDLDISNDNHVTLPLPPKAKVKEKANQRPNQLLIG
jgi:hypothetical protein